MKIVIGSGKGGTGKTTVAVNLAVALSEKMKVNLLDCDVEEPNAHIFIKPTFSIHEDVTATLPVIDKEKCKFCRQCADFCVFNALAIFPNNALVFPELCHGCGGCFIVCPENAITEEKRIVGKIESTKDKNPEFFHGVLNISEVQATGVIKKVKKHIDPEKINIIDAPPGTNCPFIETAKNSDFVILVTEPTPFGLHDLRLAYETVKQLNVPIGVIINKDGIGNNKTETFCRDNKIDILMKIPHSREIAEIYSRGDTIVEKLPEYKKQFIELFEEIEKKVP